MKRKFYVTWNDMDQNEMILLSDLKWNEKTLRSGSLFRTHTLYTNS